MGELEAWLPPGMLQGDTFRGVERSGSRDARLSGVRLPLSEEDIRRIAATSGAP